MVANSVDDGYSMSYTTGITRTTKGPEEKVVLEATAQFLDDLCVNLERQLSLTTEVQTIAGVTIGEESTKHDFHTLASNDVSVCNESMWTRESLTKSNRPIVHNQSVKELENALAINQPRKIDGDSSVRGDVKKRRIYIENIPSHSRDRDTLPRTAVAPGRQLRQKLIQAAKNLKESSNHLKVVDRRYPVKRISSASRNNVKEMLKILATNNEETESTGTQDDTSASAQSDGDSMSDPIVDSIIVNDEQRNQEHGLVNCKKIRKGRKKAILQELKKVIKTAKMGALKSMPKALNIRSKTLTPTKDEKFLRDIEEILNHRKAMYLWASSLRQLKATEDRFVSQEIPFDVSEAENIILQNTIDETIASELSVVVSDDEDNPHVRSALNVGQIDTNEKLDFHDDSLPHCSSDIEVVMGTLDDFNFDSLTPAEPTVENSVNSSLEPIACPTTTEATPSHVSFSNKGSDFEVNSISDCENDIEVVMGSMADFDLASLPPTDLAIASTDKVSSAAWYISVKAVARRIKSKKKTNFSKGINSRSVGGGVENMELDF